MLKNKILLIRFSSIGDVLQSLSLPPLLKKGFSNVEIHWATKSEFVELIENHPDVNQVWGVNKNGDSFFEMILLLRKQGFSHIYDAHNNLRSLLLCIGLRILRWGERRPKLLRRSIFRWKRFLLFRFRINLFLQPFSGQRDLIAPLKKWNIPTELPPPPQLFLSAKSQSKAKEILVQHQLLNKNFVCLAPSAAHELKKWPLTYWQRLVQEWPIHFVLLGGPKDSFLEEIASIAPQRIINLAGTLSLSESAAVIGHSKLLIANDTGLLHAAEQLGHLAIALMGPAPFGFPSRYSTTRILEKNLKCRPCSKHGQGPCRNPEFQECLRSILPEFVIAQAQDHIQRNHSEVPQ